MQDVEHAWAARFYGMPLTRDVTAATRERLTDRSIDDLVTAHLAINRVYFGGIDKTLSGFVILDDDGDDYTLLDARDSGQVWWQDHETRELALRYDTLADYIAVQTADSEGGSNAEQRRANHVRHGRTVATPVLCARYQWLVWLLAVPHEQPGRPLPSTDQLVRRGLGRFRELFPTRETLEAAFEAELPELADDPHLAIYWLLHTTMLADHDRRARVLAAVGASEHSLWRAFASRLGALPLEGDVPVVPDFRARRALATTYGAFELSPDELPAACLRALEISPATASLAHGLQVVAGLERGAIDLGPIRATLDRIGETTTGTALLAAVLDNHANAIASGHADTLARLLATCDDPWWAQLEALWRVHELAYDGPALVAATRRILVHDRFHRRALQMAMRAKQIANEPIDDVYADLGVADALLAPYAKLVDEPAQWRSVVGALPLPHLRRALALRVLQRVELHRPPPELAAWAAEQVLASSDPARVQLVSEAIGMLDSDTQVHVIDILAAASDGADHPLVDVLLAFLDLPDADDTDAATQVALRRGKEAALRVLARRAPDAAPSTAAPPLEPEAFARADAENVEVVTAPAAAKATPAANARTATKTRDAARATPAAKAATATTPKPAAKGKLKPAAKGKLKPAAKGKPKPAAKGKVKPAAKAKAKPAAKAKAKPAANGKLKPAAKAKLKPAGKGKPKPTTKAPAKRTPITSRKT